LAVSKYAAWLAVSRPSTVARMFISRQSTMIALTPLLPGNWAVEALHEGSIDLDLVERKAPQIAKARIAGGGLCGAISRPQRSERRPERKSACVSGEADGIKSQLSFCRLRRLSC
jgi:hypothetical protein